MSRGSRAFLRPGVTVVHEWLQDIPVDKFRAGDRQKTCPPTGRRKEPAMRYMLKDPAEMTPDQRRCEVTASSRMSVNHPSPSSCDPLKLYQQLHDKPNL